MGAGKWLLIIIGMVLGVFIPWHYQLVVMAAMLMGYASCYSLGWKRFQLWLAYLFGGLSTGLGLQFLIAYGMHNQVAPMIIAPLLIWLVLRIFFYAVETKYTLHPNEALSQIRAQDEATEYQQADTSSMQGHSAWSGDTSGRASSPDADGQFRYYQFYCTGEIAMGGPTYGEVVFSNRCAFTGVGPSIVLSEDGRYAAMTLPSRSQWGFLLVDLQAKLVYEPEGATGFWEIDRIENGNIYGRHSPLVSNAAQKLAITDLVLKVKAQPLVEDDGWWVLDYPERKPLPKYAAVTIKSKQGSHKVTFVPDLKAHKANPFARMQHPNYIITVDDALLDMEANYPHALWVDGDDNSNVQDGRFLVIQHKIFDFRNAVHDVFEVTHPVELSIQALDEFTNIALGDYSDAGHGLLAVQGIVMPRSIGFNEAEYESYSTTHPWDDEQVTYWDIKSIKRRQSRTRIQSHVQYLIDLPKYSHVKSMHLCTEIQILNRASSANWAKLSPVTGKEVGKHYRAYTLSTSCAVTLADVTHEAIWSHCGRYLAVVFFEFPPQVPHRIAIVDFETAGILELAGIYALPSFIWFDKTMLEFSHVLGVNETINYGMGKESSHTAKRISEPSYSDKPYELLIDSLPARTEALEKLAAKKKTGKGYSGASVKRVSQHIILFAPEFNKPILQPPVKS